LGRGRREQSHRHVAKEKYYNCNALDQISGRFKILNLKMKDLQVHSLVGLSNFSVKITLYDFI